MEICVLGDDYVIRTVQKLKFSIKNFSSKCDQIHSFLQIWSHLPKNSLKSIPHLPKNISLYLLQRKHFKIDEKRFLFHLKYSFHSQDIEIFALTFPWCRKKSLIRGISLISKFMMS